MNFAETFELLTGNPPFPWQQSLYRDWFSIGRFPSSCSLPTGLGKTSVVAIWMIALAQNPDQLPRRLVYVVNRRTVVDQTTTELENYRKKLQDLPSLAQMRSQLVELGAIKSLNQSDTIVAPFALSTLRGQFADNREWSADPCRPAVIVGTVDMIGSRLLFSGYGIGFKSKPLHAGFLGQDVLLVHDEAHLEAAFQQLLLGIEREQERFREFSTFRVMELTATSRGTDKVFRLSSEDYANEEVVKRIEAKKHIKLHKFDDEKKTADTIAKLAQSEHTKDQAVLVFVRKLDDVEKIVNQLPKGATQQLTGTLRGLERDRMADPRKENGCPIFARFLPAPKQDASESEDWKVKPQTGTVYLVCTSAGEVGVNISADQMVCDLSTFESMAQRFGRLNRFGNRSDSLIHIVHRNEFDSADQLDLRRQRTLKLLFKLNGDGSPKALSELDNEERQSAFAPTPTIRPTSDVLFDAWAMTSIRGKLPGRPLVEPYLHGITEWELPVTHVAWRAEVEIVTKDLLIRYAPQDLLEDYPIKPHELLQDNSGRVFSRLKKLKAKPDTPIWVVSDDGSVDVTTLGELIETGKEELDDKTVLLPPSAGGLDNGQLSPASTQADDVADELFDRNQRRRMRLRGDDPRLERISEEMRLIRIIDLRPDLEDAKHERDFWYWYESPKCGDGEGSKTSRKPVSWQAHTDDVVKNAELIVERLSLRDDIKSAILLAAKFHDLGKKRVRWQRSIGNPTPTSFLAKSGAKMKPLEFGDGYRHEFGSLVDILDPQQRNLLELKLLSDEMQEVVLHLVAAHHGFGRPHFSADNRCDPEPKGTDIQQLSAEVAQRFARLQQKYGRWPLAYLESLLRAADYAASASPSAFVEDIQ